MKKLFVVFILFISFNLQAITILLDPGHGGEDTGAKMNYSYRDKKGHKRKLFVYEKDLVLIYARKIQAKLKKKGLSVHLTRSFDRKVSLDKRAEVAEKLKADIFISIHMNASFKRSSKGFETYYLDNHKDAAVKKVEDIENKDLSGEQLVINKIITDLVIERTAKTSKKLASHVHKHISKKVRRAFKLKDRGIKPGLFYVLAMAKRPGILLEVSFISNPKELRKILTPSFQEKYSDGVAEGIISYLRSKK